MLICLKRDKEIALKPEEAVRQLYLYKLIHEYGYPTSRIEVEFPIHFGREVKRADIAIMDKDRLMVPYIIVELKKPKLTDGKEQLKSYCNATGAPIGVWTNGEQISYYNRKDPNYFEPITNIPKVSEKLADIINEKFTYAVCRLHGAVAGDYPQLGGKDHLFLLHADGKGEDRTVFPKQRADAGRNPSQAHSELLSA